MGSAYNRVIETRKELTKQLLAEMEQGELPWMKGWKTTGTRPYNPVTKAVYKGNNRLRLMLASHFGQFQDNRWEFPIVKDTTPNITNSRLNNIP